MDTLRVTIVLIATTVSAQCQINEVSKATAKGNMPEYIQEFFLSEAVRCQEKGEFQITFATESRQRIGSNAGVQIEYGLTDRLQFSAELPYRVTAIPGGDERYLGLSSTDVGLLYQFMQRAHPFALSAGMMIEVPIQSKGQLSYESVILLAKAFGKLQIHASLLSEIEEMKPSFDYNVASVYPVKPHWFPTFELNGRRRHDAKNAFYLTPGLYHHYSKRIETGIGTPIGLGRFGSRLGVVAKLNWELGGDEKH
jgi:hypothetical protein